MASGSPFRRLLWRAVTVHAVTGGCLVVMTDGDFVNGVPLQALYADNFCTSVKTEICPRRPLTPSTAPGRARAARGQQRGTIYWQTGRVCLQPGGLLCGSRPPPQLKGWRSGWTPPARTRRAKGNGHRTLPAAPIFPVAPGAGYEGALSFYFMLCHQFAMDLNQARRDRWPSALAVVMV